MKPIYILLIISIIIITGCSQNNDPQLVDEGRVIILIYHRLVQGKAANLYERDVEDFKADIEYLEKNRINVISFCDLMNISVSGKMPSGNSAIITFDDGDDSWFNLAQPVLKKHGMKATFFLWVQMIGRDSFISWNDVELMSHYTIEGGVKPFTFGSHTFSHPYLFGRKSGYADQNQYNVFLDYELGESKRLIEMHTPGKVEILALPFGDGAGDTDIITAADRNGYKCIRISTPGTISDADADLFTIPALPMLDDTKEDLIGYYLNSFHIAL
jgi:hypothetical protein